MSKRIQRVNQLLKEESSKILLKEMDFPKDTLVTVTRVETSSDLRQTKIYISCLPENQNLKVLQILNKNFPSLQKRIGERLSIKIIPKLKFFEDKETQKAAKIEELLEKIKKKP